MKTSIYIFVALSVLLTVFSCSEKKISENELKFKNYKADSTYHLFRDATKPAIRIDLEMEYPVEYKNAAVLDTLQQLIILGVTDNHFSERDPEKAMQKFMAKKVADYRLLENDKRIEQLIKEEDNHSGSFSNQYTSKEKTIFNKGDIFCFSVNTYSFTGGAHGLGIIKYTCVDLDNGRVITEKDLFVEDYESLLAPIILEKLAEAHNLKSPKELENNGFFDISEIKPNNNFYINEKGITYAYNPYEIAAYVIGISEVFISYGDISFILASKSPVKRFL